MSQWEEIQKVVNHPGAVKCHWFTRHLRDPALLELVILVTKLHYLCIDLPFSMNATMASAGKRDPFLIPGCILACQQSWKGLLVEGEEKPRGSEPQGKGMARSRFYW